ncbi:MAG: helix-turn-helix transcriptional regulator [Selenomonadaceae bacterium]|nr:helix-turn-helix transcriptional regulator [Selenomonadaceae bacterium]
MQKKELNVAIGGRIRKVREHQHYTREQIAEKADISAQFLADIENGYKSMTAATIINLANALHISTDYILLGTEPNNNTETMDEIQSLLSAIPKDK